MIRPIVCGLATVALTAGLSGGATVQAAPHGVPLSAGSSTGFETGLKTVTKPHWPFAESVAVTIYSPKLKTRAKGKCAIYISDFEYPASSSTGYANFVSGKATTYFKVYEPGMYFAGAVCRLKGRDDTQISSHFTFDVS